MPTILDLTWKPSNAAPQYPADDPTVAPAVYRGDGYTILLVLMDGANPWNPEGTLRAQVRKERIKASATVTDPIAEFEITVDANEVTCHLTGDATVDIPDSAYWDLQEEFDDADPRTWFTGRVKAWGDLTREAVGS